MNDLTIDDLIAHATPGIDEADALIAAARDLEQRALGDPEPPAPSDHTAVVAAARSAAATLEAGDDPLPAIIDFAQRAARRPHQPIAAHVIAITRAELEERRNHLLRTARRPQLTALAAEHDRIVTAARAAHDTGDTTQLDRLADRYADIRQAWADRMLAELKALHGDHLEPGRVRLNHPATWLANVEDHWPAYHAAVDGLDLTDTTVVPRDPWPDRPAGQLRWLAATPAAKAWLTDDPEALTTRHTEVRTAMHGPDPEPVKVINVVPIATPRRKVGVG